MADARGSAGAPKSGYGKVTKREVKRMLQEAEGSPGSQGRKNSPYHAHIYYRPTPTAAPVPPLRAWVEARFPVRMGSWHDVPVGPHPTAMDQIAFQPEVFPTLPVHHSTAWG